MNDIAYVDRQDIVIGFGSLENALKRGIAHRASLVILRNSSGEILIQHRSMHVHAWPGRWDFSAAGHVDKNESYATAAIREMKEELGVSGVELDEIARFYIDESIEAKKELKHRFNALYCGVYDGDVDIDETEVLATQWISTEKLEAWMRERSDDFTPTFHKGYRLYKGFVEEALSSKSSS